MTISTLWFPLAVLSSSLGLCFPYSILEEFTENQSSIWLAPPSRTIPDIQSSSHPSVWVFWTSPISLSAPPEHLLFSVDHPLEPVIGMSLNRL